MVQPTDCGSEDDTSDNFSLRSNQYPESVSPPGRGNCLPVLINVSVLDGVSEKDIARNIMVDETNTDMVNGVSCVLMVRDFFGHQLTISPGRLSFLSHRSGPSCDVPARDAIYKRGRRMVHLTGLTMDGGEKGCPVSAENRWLLTWMSAPKADHQSTYDRSSSLISYTSSLR